MPHGIDVAPAQTYAHPPDDVSHLDRHQQTEVVVSRRCWSDLDLDRGWDP